MIEVKYAETKESLVSECEKALQQINEKGYTDSLKQKGKTIIRKYGIACNKKECKVLAAEPNRKCILVENGF